MTAPMPGSRRLMLSKGERVYAAGAGIAHHHATGHTGGGFDNDYDCETCRFRVANGIVTRGGMIEVTGDPHREAPG